MKTLVQKLSNNRPEDPINDPNSEINGKELDKTLKPGTMVQNMFSTLWASVWCKNKGGPPHTPPGPVTDWN